MDKKPLIGICICAVVLLVLCSLSNVVGYNTVQASQQNLIKERIKLSCCFFTVDGVELVINEVTIQDANHLIQLMNGSDSDAIVSELNRLNLLSKTMSIEQAKELVSGGYGQKICQYSQQVSHSKQLNDSGWKENFNCKISGRGIDAYIMPLRTYHFLTALDWFFYLTIGWFGMSFADIFYRFFFIYLFIGGIASLPNILVESYQLDIGQFFIPIKLMPRRVYAELFDTSHYHENPPYLSTSGANGTWSIENYTWIPMYMEDFYGVWLSFHEPGHLFGANVKGYCSNIHANGKDEYLRNRYWGDYDWPWQ